MAKKEFQNEIDVLKYQREKINSIDKGYSKMNSQLDEFEKQIQEYIKNKDIDKANIAEYISNNKEKQSELEKVECKPQKKFDDLINHAHQSGYSDRFI